MLVKRLLMAAKKLTQRPRLLMAVKRPTPQIKIN
jgi:hypothetical protein